LRYSDLERAIPGISQKMLAQQLGSSSGTASSRAPSTPKSHRRLSTASPAGASPCAPRSTSS
jgi:hypothetical protein